LLARYLRQSTLYRIGFNHRFVSRHHLLISGWPSLWMRSPQREALGVQETPPPRSTCFEKTSFPAPSLLVFFIIAGQDIYPDLCHFLPVPCALSSAVPILVLN
jgi:hypothetical protein